MSQSLEFLAAARDAALPLAGDAVALYDPVPMRMARLKNLERGQLLVESASRPALQAFLASWNGALHEIKAPRELRWHLDVDPLEF
jgi:primosomal protein N' (replication factor Y)